MQSRGQGSLGYGSGVDRDAIARSQRRRQARETLEFERNRTTGLEEQIEELVAEQDGARIDEEAFAGMEPEDAAAVRAILHPEGVSVEDDEWLGMAQGLFDSDSDPDDPPDDPEEEIARLQAEIDDSRRRQQLLERYLDALGD